MLLIAVTWLIGGLWSVHLDENILEKHNEEESKYVYLLVGVLGPCMPAFVTFLLWRKHN